MHVDFLKPVLLRNGMYQVEVTDLQETLEINPEQLTQVVKKLLSDEQVIQASISIVLVDHPQMRQLNNDYLSHDYNTDVLSFLLECEQAVPVQNPDANAFRGVGKRLEGEVIVCTEMAQEMAADFHWTAREEVLLYLVHGVLHLLGYDDLTPEELQRMRQRERDVLAGWNLTPSYENRPSQNTDSPPSLSGTDSIRENSETLLSDSPNPDGEKT